MALLTVNNVKTTLDETEGRQNSTATPAQAGDADDNDILVSSLPIAFSGRLEELGLVDPDIGAALSGYDGANTGSNIISIDPAAVGTITELAFVGPDGNPLNGLDSGLDTVDGVDILLYTDTDNNIVLGRAGAADGPIVLALYLEETGDPVSGAKIWSVQDSALFNTNPNDPDDSLNLADKVFVAAAQDLEFSLANAPSGQNLFLMFTTENPATVDVNGVIRISDPAIIATGKEPADQSEGEKINTGDTINTSQATNTTFGTNNQMINEDQAVVFSFVTGARQDVTIPNLDQNEADIEANIDFTEVFNARSATFDVVQLQSGKSAVVEVSAKSTESEPGADFVNGYTDDAAVDITRIIVSQNGTVLIDTSTGGTENDVTVAFNNGVATISGVEAGYNIQYFTSVDHNRVYVENGGSGTGQASADFDIGGFQLLQVNTEKVEVGSKLNFEDDGPTVSANAAVQLDDDALSGGNPGGVGDDPDAVNTSGTLGHSFGADGAGSIAYLATGAPTGFTYEKSGDNLLVKQGATTVLTLTLDTATGAYTVTQDAPIAHEAGNDENNQAFTINYQVTDSDGDTADGTLSIDVDDDTPTVSANAAVQLDDDALSGGNPGGVGDDPDAVNTSGTLGHSFGADGAGSIAYLATGAPTGFTYEKSGDNLLVKQGATTVLTLTLDTATGAYTVTQDAPIAHEAGNDENNQAFTINYQVTDSDGDTADGTLSIDVDDDTPTEFSPASVTLTNNGTDVETGDLDFIGHVGADQPGSIVFVDNFPDDDYLRDTDGTIRQSGSENIVLSGFGTGILTAQTEDTLLTVFTATLDPDNDQYTIDFDRAIDDGSGVTFLGAAPVRSGNPAFNILNDVGGSELDILFSGTIPGTDTVNVSTQGAGTGNQTMNAGETLRLDVGTGIELAGSPLGSDFNFTADPAHQTVNGFSFLLTQNTPSGTTGTVFIQAFDADDDKILSGDADDTIDPITMVKINGEVLGDGDSVTINGHEVTAIFHNDGVVITGLNEGATGDGAGGDDPEIVISTADGFNRVELTNYSGQTVNSEILSGTDFDIAPAGFEQTEIGDPFSFELPVQITDEDGDPTPIELIGVNVEPVI